MKRIIHRIVLNNSIKKTSYQKLSRFVDEYSIKDDFVKYGLKEEETEELILLVKKKYPSVKNCAFNIDNQTENIELNKEGTENYSVDLEKFIRTKKRIEISGWTCAYLAILYTMLSIVL